MDAVVKLLAIAGGALVGGLVVAFVTGAAVRAVSTRKMPPWARSVMRLLGAVAGGWLVALWLLGGGGWGIGGIGGRGIGSGSGRGPSSARREGPEVTPSSPATQAAPAAEGERLTVEVLGDAPLRKLASRKDSNPQRRYRIDRQQKAELLTLRELKDLIHRRHVDGSLRQVTIVLYNDSPARDVRVVSELRDWAAEDFAQGRDKLQLEYREFDADAPVP
jgi:hypothetical protein